MGGLKGDTGSADSRNFSAKSVVPEFFKIKAKPESTNSAAKNSKKNFTIRLYTLT